ncbi:uncharacterized protein LOC114944529 [Nylanderia fulva]|uniref:uncharacterized protein LOC114944529 n=1 Tax=Nylanderia fulva TaxID=613905 RepID=UPI0010FB23CB|nr:uncharacterized protein LOC114944529 [Nylanderia fulva]
MQKPKDTGKEDGKPLKPQAQKPQVPKPQLPRKRREPKTAAITITCPPGQYKSVMREAREKIDLEDLGIKEGVKIRRAITGALMYEVTGGKSQELADNLARRLKVALADKEGIKI